MNIKFRTVIVKCKMIFPPFNLKWNHALNRATHIIMFRHWNAEQFSRKKTHGRAGLCAASSWALEKTLTVRLLTAFPLKWLEIFTVASERLKLLLMLTFGEYVGGYLNFFPEDSSSNAPAGMGIGPPLTHAVICCLWLKSKTVNIAHPSRHLEGRQEHLCQTAKDFSLRNEEPVGKVVNDLGWSFHLFVCKSWDVLNWRMDCRRVHFKSWC